MSIHHPRSDWTDTISAADTALVAAEVDGLAVHHHGGGPIAPAPALVAAALRGWRTYHVNGHGWDDIAYNVAVDQAGNRWELRGLRVRSAANGNADVNRRYCAVLAILGDDEQPTAAMVEELRAVVRDVRRLYPGALAIKGHQDVRPDPTSCPGAILEQMIRAGRLEPGAAPTGTTRPPSRPNPPRATAPAFPLPAGSYFGPKAGPAASVSGYYSHRADLRRFQAQLVSRGWRVEPDGLYGPDTARVVLAFQREKHLKADGLVGPATWAAAWTAPVT